MNMKALPFISVLTLALASPRITDTSIAPNSSTTPAPTTPDGTICECGYTYCASVLMAMKKPWTTKQLAEAYCATPNAVCSSGKPSTSINSALYICLCEDPGQKLGNQLDLLCGCDKCLVVGPDFRGRCETPCHAGQCKT
ncbi:hypothetical protein J3459_017552 [Metarhizium acridum]|uniref:Uncharacterized protein n=1 Tax=Metarhizium acridum (strain CQMa 102) TaxID=655827 RepID=E9EA97_METAQ|nr:uncharacterized protein MAC_06796 [Metarhizium acridum CQMa 102]EFY87118.1 hypothetical protein MAC_06796 [Metarhizium acridum CQMa 102]KAG8408473.1 hypothetical protein J3458_019508 [Metarhizium acridum]KAG8409374.1 hypothetical protein J3459_017552 [Metarhizium acridum]